MTEIGRGIVQVILDNKTYMAELEKTRAKTAARVGEIGKAWVKGVTLPVAALGAVSLKMGADFQTSMTRIHTQAGGSAKDVKTLGDQVLKLASHSQSGPKALADSLYHLKSVGLDNNKAMQALVATQKLADVGGSDLEQTTNAVAGAWRSGIKGAQNFGTEVGTLNAIVGAGNMKMQDLVGAMSTGFLTTGKTFGLSLRSMGSALALLTDQGTPATAAATRIRMSISLLGAPSGKAAGLLQDIGLSAGQMAETMRKPNGLIKVIQLLHDHLGKVGDKAKQAQFLSAAFGGGRSSSAIMSMVNNLGVLKDKYKQIGKTAGNFNKDVEAQSKTVAASWAKTKASLETAAVRIGTVLMPIAQQLAKWFGNLASTFANMSPTAQKFVVTLALVAATVGPVLVVGAKLVKSFMILKDAWEALNLTFLTSPIGLVIAGVALLAVGLIVAYKKSKTFREIIQGAFHGIVAAGKAVGAFFSGPFLRFFEGVGNKIKGVGNSIQSGWNAVGRFFAKTVPGWFTGATKAVGRFFTKTIPGAVQTVLGFLKSHWKLIPAIIGGPIGIVVTVVLTHWNAIKRGTVAAFNAVKGAISTALGAIKRVFIRGWDAYITIVTTVWRNIIHVVAAGGQAILRAVRASLNAVSTVVRNILGAVGRFFTRIWNQYVALFKKMGHLVWAAVKAAFDGVSNVVTNVMHAVGKFLVRAWNNDVATVKRAVGLIWNGVKAGFNAVRNTTRTILNDVATFIKRVFLKTLPDAIRTGVGSIGRVWKGIKNLFSGPVDWVIKNVINRLIGAVDWVAGKLGHPNLIHKINTHAAGTSQVLPGYTPGRDVHTFYSASAGTLKLSGGEGIARPEVVRAMGSRFDGANAAARKGGVRGAAKYMSQSFATGGRTHLPGQSTPGRLTWPTPGHIVTTYPGHDGVDINAPGQDYGNPIWAIRNGTIAYAGWGHGYGDAIFERIAGGPTVVYGHTSKTYVHAGEFVNSGKLIGRVGSTGNSSGPHLHFGVPGGTAKMAMALLGGALNVGGGGFLGGLGGFLSSINPLKLLGKALGGLGSLILGHVPGGKFGKAIATGALSKLKGFAGDVLQNLAATFMSNGSFGGPGLTGQAKGKYEQYAFSLFKRFGWGASDRGPLLALWNQESGWSPTARNTKSGAYGIPQALPASKIPGGYSSTPGAQIRWGLGYIKGRYGSPAGAWAHEVSHNWYDRGGLAIGRGMFKKNTPLPERVLSPRQTVAFERWLNHAPAVRAHGNGNSANTTTRGRRVELVITNWASGEGYFRSVADDQIDAASQYAAGRTRMGAR